VNINERIARAYISHLTEPMDQDAAALVLQHGAVDAVDIMITGDNRWRPRHIKGLKLDTLPEWYAEILGRYQNVAFRVPNDPGWPDGLNDLGLDAPFGLWVRAQDPGAGLVLNSKPRVAVVGARAATSYGEHVAVELVSDLVAGHGVAIISGAAYGIDGAAHRAALAAGGITVAFLAGGVDRPYPVGHAQLIERITHSGMIAAEVPPGSAPTKWRFLARNRLIAAVGQASVVVEAGWRSGSLNEAGHAVKLERPLGAVPGPITSAASAGCHRLIREFGAACITSTHDVLELIGIPQPADPNVGVDEMAGT
jgi:DNA processing protein